MRQVYAVIGCGHWGKIIVDILIQMNCYVKYIVTHRIVGRSYRDIDMTTDYDFVLYDQEVTSIVIATPAESHYEIAKKSLLFKKHTIVEKPIALNYLEAQELKELAYENNCVLMVDQTFLYSQAIDCVKKYVHNKIDVKYIESLRYNHGNQGDLRKTTYELLPHDLCIIQYITDQKPIAIKIEKFESHVDLFIRYQTFISHVSLSLNYAFKKRFFSINCGDLIYTNDVSADTVCLNNAASEIFFYNEMSLKNMIIDFERRVQCNYNIDFKTDLAIEIVKYLEKILFFIGDCSDNDWHEI